MTPEEYVEKLKEQNKRLEARFRDDLDVILKMPQGRRIIAWILNESEFLLNAYSGDKSSTEFKAGMQKLGQKLFIKIMEVSPDKYLQMLREEKSDAERRRTELPPPADL